LISGQAKRGDVDVSQEKTTLMLILGFG